MSTEKPTAKKGTTQSADESLHGAVLLEIGKVARGIVELDAERRILGDLRRREQTEDIRLGSSLGCPFSVVDIGDEDVKVCVGERIVFSEASPYLSSVVPTDWIPDLAEAYTRMKNEVGSAREKLNKYLETLRGALKG